MNEFGGSTVATNDDLVRLVRWILEHMFPAPTQPCSRCGHDADSHRLDDSTNVSPVDPSAEFRCIWPTIVGPVARLCDCPDFIPTPGYTSIAVSAEVEVCCAACPCEDYDGPGPDDEL